jgi:uncharacterized Zn finger protein (UPF0148 family)
MPEPNDKLIVALVECSICGNPFMIKKGQKKTGELICDNCIKLEQRKKQLADSVIESQKNLENSIKGYKSSLRVAKSQQIKQLFFDKIKKTSTVLNNSVDQQIKQLFFDKIKKTSTVLNNSVELLKKIEETNDEKYIEQYKNLFDKMKKEHAENK